MENTNLMQEGSSDYVPYELINGIQYGEPDYEIIGGEKVYMAAAPNIPHGLIVARLIGTFIIYIDSKDIAARVLGDNVDIYFSEEDHFKPDVSVLCDLNIIGDGKRLYSAPDLVVEVLSESSKKDDTGRKKVAYEKYGVKEYWLVDPDEKIIQVYHLVDGKFVDVGEYKLHSDKEKIEVSIFEDLTVDLRNVFKWWLN